MGHFRPSLQALPAVRCPLCAKSNRRILETAALRCCVALLGREHLEGEANQLRALIDILHVHGIAMLLDVVNYAGGEFGDESLLFIDRLAYGNNNDSLYFTDQGWAGGLVFAYWNEGVRQFLIDNARFFLDEFHVDGFRYDEVLT